jgi:hypothetical protein
VGRLKALRGEILITTAILALVGIMLWFMLGFGESPRQLHRSPAWLAGERNHPK